MWQTHQPVLLNQQHLPDGGVPTLGESQSRGTSQEQVWPPDPQTLRRPSCWGSDVSHLCSVKDSVPWFSASGHTKGTVLFQNGSPESCCSCQGREVGEWGELGNRGGWVGHGSLLPPSRMSEEVLKAHHVFDDASCLCTDPHPDPLQEAAPVAGGEAGSQKLV